MNRPAADLQPETDFRARFTTAEFLRMAEGGAFADMKVELVDGELERMTPPMSAHARRQMEIAFALKRIFENRPDIAVVAEIGIDLGGNTVRACDAAVATSWPEENRLLTPGELLLVVEIAETTLARDLGPKRIDYARAGIPNYWVVDGERSVVHVYVDPIKGEYADVRTVRFGDPLAVPATDEAIVID